MDARDIIQVEDFLFKNKRKRLAAASCMHSIVGVLIDLKPVAFIDFSAEEMKTADCLEFKGMLEKIGLKCVFQHHQIASPDGLELFENIYISKKFDLAAKLRNVFIEMWSTMDDFGQVLDQKIWIRTSRQIGRMLGYPDTAIDGFIRDRIEHRIGSDSLTVIAGKYRTFAHSKKYLKKEIKAYDDPLEKAVKKYAPKTYALFEERI